MCSVCDAGRGGKEDEHALSRVRADKAALLCLALWPTGICKTKKGQTAGFFKGIPLHPPKYGHSSIPVSQHQTQTATCVCTH